MILEFHEAFWGAVARRSRDTAFERGMSIGCHRMCESGVALRFPPQSKAVSVFITSSRFTANFLECGARRSPEEGEREENDFLAGYLPLKRVGYCQLSLRDFKNSG